jgi:Sap-like sulfolipid-1-addressing protein
VSRAFLFALTAALNPTLLTATTVMLLIPNPKRLMLGYLAGALTTGVVLGVAIVEWLSDSGAVSESKHTVAPGIDLALGLIALVAAYVVQSGRVERRRARRREKRGDKPKKVPRWQEALSGGSARATYLVGLLLSFPGASYLASLTEVSKLKLNVPEVVLTVLALNAVMLVLLELPLISFAVAPEWTSAAIERFKAWLAQHGGKALVIGLTVIGALLIVRGIVAIVS